MKGRLEPDDPAVLVAVLQRIGKVSRGEWLQRLRRRPDFDEAWVLKNRKSKRPVVPENAGGVRETTGRR